MVMLPSETADMRKLSASRARYAHELCMPHDSDSAGKNNPRMCWVVAENEGQETHESKLMCNTRANHEAHESRVYYT